MANSPALQAGRPLPPWWDARCLLEWSWRRSSGPGRIGSDGPTGRMSGREFVLPPHGGKVNAMLRGSPPPRALLFCAPPPLRGGGARGGLPGAKLGPLGNGGVAGAATLLPPSSED